MSSLSDIGNLMHLYLDEIEPGESIKVSEFLVKASAHLLNQKGGRNWVPLIVKETGEDSYQVIGNSFIYAVAEEAGLERVWCIVADDSADTLEVTQVLAGEKTPKINLSKATREEIMAALEYLISQPGSPLKAVKLAVATNRIDEAPRQHWKNFDSVVKLKCGITKAKLEALKQVFYLTPQPMPEATHATKNAKDAGDAVVLKALTVTDLKKMAKTRGITGISKMKKDDLVKALAQA
ncbi:Rho termination factor N-terminal domain-containing protein [Pseudanabaena sp. FACHB-2040]|uniref:Rho termination factor N-terminal domain-containing protein n=1 Tax=Pseudanabaena sp. FACHB-2040 TaxID=2692859 RepID=UPI0016866B0C|nr:Rho termination factor N-terminal domain-containing protein [Pseudanabaena sp. FACHB-2040]MBD2256604.1 Rho termination factor N-terminal domain-containing protein [Pseudanabaena sp. FACHB-2040]